MNNCTKINSRKKGTESLHASHKLCSKITEIYEYFICSALISDTTTTFIYGIGNIYSCAMGNIQYEVGLCPRTCCYIILAVTISRKFRETS